MARNPGSHARLTLRDLPHFGGRTLFDRVARVVCEAECLPRKELYEAWEVARRVRRRFRGGRVLDLCAGHGLLGYLMLVLDDTSPQALVLDPKTPPSAGKLAEVLERAWPRVHQRVLRFEQPIDDVIVEPGDLLVSIHGCGALTDQVLDLAIQHRVHVAVLPCCHDVKASDTGGLTGWLEGPLAVDVVRAERLRAAGFVVHTQTIPSEITPQNRLLIAEPR